MKSRSCKHPLELPQAEGFDMNAFQSNNPIKTRVHRHGKHWFQIDCSLFDFHKLCISCKTALQKMKDCALLGQITQRRARRDALRRVIFPKRSRSGHPLRRCPEIKKNAAPLGGQRQNANCSYCGFRATSTRGRPVRSCAMRTCSKPHCLA